MACKRNTEFLLVLFLLLSCQQLCTQVDAKEKQSSNRGKALFSDNGCLDCHRVKSGGCKEGVSLDGIAKRRTRAFLKEHLRDPETHVRKNQGAFHGDPSLMPNPNLSEKEIGLIVDYLMTLKH